MPENDINGMRPKEDEREYLRKLIAEWNASRMDLFAISEPGEDLEYRGVMRFFFQDAGAKMATKCVRVTSVETAEDVTNVLVEKFRPDMKMLTNPNYSLYEVHPNGDSRKLSKEEKPLVVQLSWLEDDREGRFLLKSDSEALVTTNVFNTENDPGQSFRRRLSKREKKELKKKKEEDAKKAKILGPPSPTKSSDDSAIAQTLYNELPETSFTRSISNPEIVMKMRRQRKLEQKLKEFQSSEGVADSGGTLKIFAETLKPEIPYKTLLVSMRDPTTYVVKEALEKYKMEKENPEEYCLVMVNIPPEGANGTNVLGKERIVHDEDNPLAIAATWPKNQGHVVFHLRRRANMPQYRKQKRRSKSPSRVPQDKTPEKGVGERLANNPFPEHLLPYLRELTSDGHELDYRGNEHRLPMEVTEVGSEKSMSSGGSYLELFAPHILPRHCVITNMDGIVSVTPTSGDAEVYVDGKRIYESTRLNHGSTIKFGRLHTYKFGDPAYEENSNLPGSPGREESVSSDSDSQRRRESRSGPRGMNREYEQNNHESGLFETTFGVDGEVETYTNEKARQDLSPRSMSSQPDDGMGDKLPARLEFRESGEDAFFAAVISEVNGDRVHFKLAPTYTLYMCCRYRTSPAYREEISRQERSERLTHTVQKIANMVRSTVEENSQFPGSLAFWIANSSELLHFLNQDIDVAPLLKESQQVLYQSVQMSFKHLVQCVEQELRTLMSAFLDITEDADMEDSDVESMLDPDASDGIAGERSFRYGPTGRPIGGDSWLGGRRRHGKPTISEILFTLSSAMSLLRRCRVNATLTIQVFSHLFHYINMWIFNKLVLQPQLGLCTRDWGYRLRRRLGRVESWAQKQGLELAADCHLCRVVQAAQLLQAPKNSHSDLNNISSVCYKLNSMQLRMLLENYRPAPDELDIPRSVLLSSCNFSVKKKTSKLGLLFVSTPGLCRLTIQPASSGLWTVYHTKYNKDNLSEWIRDENHSLQGGDVSPRSPQAPEIMEVSFYKGQGGMGLSIVAAKGAGQDKLGIYIKQVVKGGAAAKDGRLQAGDQLLTVNGESLVGVPQERAAELMVKSGANVTLRIAKQGAIYHGLATLLNQPAQIVTRDPLQNLIVVGNEDLVEASPTIPEQEMQRPPGRWLPPGRSQSLNRWGEEDRGRPTYQGQWEIEEDRRKRDADEERRRIEEQRRQDEEERRLEQEKILAEHERLFREEEKRLAEQRRQAEEQRRLEEERRQEDERRLQEQRRRAEEQRRLEEERRRAEEQKRVEEERRREEERRLEEQRVYAEEQRRIEEARAREERRLAEEQRRLDEERRREEEQRQEEQRRFGEDRRRLEVERKRGEDALKMIGQQQRRQKPSVSRASPQTIQVEVVRPPARAEKERSPLTVKVAEPEMVPQKRNNYYSSPTSAGSLSPKRESPRDKEDNSTDEPPSSPIRIDSRNSRFGRYIMVTQAGSGGAQPERAGESEVNSRDNWKSNEREEFSRWQQTEKRSAEERESAFERREREEKERREQEAWRFHLERQRRGQEEIGRPDKQERDPRTEEWERGRVERGRRDRERQERKADGLVSVTRVKYHAPDKEERMERGRKIDLLLDETMRRDRERKEAERWRQQKGEDEEKLRSERQQRLSQQLETDREQQRESQRRLREQRDKEQEEWLKEQREKRDQLRIDQEKMRLEKKMQEEEDRNKKRQEIQQRREQEELLRRESEKQKQEQERLLAEEKRNAELRRDIERKKQFEEQRIVKEKEEQLRKQLLEGQQQQEGRTRKPSTEDHVSELKSRATADYERRRKLIDVEVSRQRPEPVSALKNPSLPKPKKQVSFSNVATEISDPTSSYVVGSSAGYTARVTPAPSIKYVNTRAPIDEPDAGRPPILDDDDELPPPPPPPPPPEELLEDDNLPPPPPMKSQQSYDRFSALSNDRSRSLGYSSRVTVTSQGPPEYPPAYSNAGIPLRQPPVTSSSAYPSYVTLPRKPRPVSYPNAFEMNQQGPAMVPTRYGSQENVLDGPGSRPQPPPSYAPKPARLDSAQLNGPENARGRLARMSLTDEEKSESQFVSKKPENLHFRDKLKMFNKESPEEKVRASKWQQEQLSQINGDY
ncbi:PREDICTED: afadin-like [Acropora digitifera]|uniref:afadin-like n=1 Tax=Acropora digitifera TaxID=70779 RepID=UPI00077A728A|nr:PREDICTED: afadin-like [Acropora digitifera]